MNEKKFLEIILCNKAIFVTFISEVFLLGFDCLISVFLQLYDTVIYCNSWFIKRLEIKEPLWHIQKNPMKKHESF